VSAGAGAHAAESRTGADRGGRAALILVLLASLAFSTFIARTLPLLDPDEGRNAEVGREMAMSGDVLIPHLAGMPYLDKPPAFFWLVSLSVRRFGHTPLAARLPSILASLITLALFGRAARRAGGDRFAWIAMALLASAPLFAGLSAYVIFDMLLTLCVTVVWLGVAAESAGGSSAWLRFAMFAAIALGILTKGPVMLAWMLGGSVGAALLMRSRAPLRWMAWWPGWVVGLGLPGLWLWSVSARFPEFAHYALLEESLERMTTDSFHRQQPWWFVPVVLIGGALPWSLITPWRSALGPRSSPGVRVTATVGAGFLAFAAIFFTLSQSKLVTYLLPAFPPLAWVAATAWNETAGSRRRWIIRWAVLGVLTALLVVALPLLTPDLGPSGSKLAAGIARAGGGPLCYRRCYSPGTDYLLGVTSPIVSLNGVETTSNYIVRYRDALKARGQWRALGGVPRDFSGLVVINQRDSLLIPRDAWVFRDGERFAAYRIGSAPDTAAPRRDPLEEP
jgi:4-amino-4-deoxy-L-arabinose transferase-like glycosyltransferase